MVELKKRISLESPRGQVEVEKRALKQLTSHLKNKDFLIDSNLFSNADHSSEGLRPRSQFLPLQTDWLRRVLEGFGRWKFREILNFCIFY